MDKLTILLIDDDKITCDEIRDCIIHTDDMYLIGITDNVYDALERIQTAIPDVILLELELHHGGGNGLFFLQELSQMQLTVKPFILITTNNTSPVTFSSARQLGADFILAKHESGYSPQYVIDFIHIVKDAVLSRATTPRQLQPKLSLNKVEQNLNQRIQRELHLIGISPKAVGFRYLTDAIRLTMQKGTANIYCILSEKYNKSKESIERAMQNAINRTWQTSNTEELSKYYTARIRSDRGVPTLMEFIHYYAIKLDS